MSSLKHKKIILCVTGSIAAYKSAVLVRNLVKQGAEVKVLMTPDSHSFITPLTLSTLSKNPVLTEFEIGSEGTWNNHVDLGLWADIIVIAPATANTIAKLANGFCDNLVLATILSSRCPLMVFPAMDLDMYIHPAVVKNINTLKSFGYAVIDADTGELASGLHGQGRMVEPEEIVNLVEQKLNQHLPLKGMKALVSAGPTFENIDPVRFIGNHSTGKMGFAIAQSLANRGADVTLVAGPSSLSINHPLIHRVNVQSAAEMYDACVAAYKNADLTIMSAAVADYRPDSAANSKIKKSSDSLELKLVKTKDILKELGSLKKKKQVLVGFALETDNEMEYAKGKLEKKNLDFVIMNSLNDAGAGFKHDTNRVYILSKNGQTIDTGLKTKVEIAEDIVKVITGE